jgi:hypothetical protein
MFIVVVATLCVLTAAIVMLVAQNFTILVVFMSLFLCVGIALAISGMFESIACLYEGTYRRSASTETTHDDSVLLVSAGSADIDGLESGDAIALTEMSSISPLTAASVVATPSVSTTPLQTTSDPAVSSSSSK